MVFYLPVAFGKYVIKRLQGIKEPTPREQNIWLEHSEFKDFKLWTLALGQEELTNILEADALDFPDWKDWEDPFRNLLKLKTEPVVQELEHALFDEMELVTESGIYLIRINAKGNGMTLCLLSAKRNKLIEITRLKPLSWVIQKKDKSHLQLSGYADGGKYVVNVKTDDVF